MYDHYSGSWGWGYVLMFVGMALFWGLLILGIFLLIRYAGHGPAESGSKSFGGSPSARFPPPRHSAEQLLAERFARGEIDETEYRSRLTVLRTEPSP
ncbi:hypothetical protein [Rhodococcus sp. IEGM 1379]|uniref:hypothetical protein n=1 Tax=Rhodococcus sp. IEGM 1379 TaxID=3047086 RepID=UPI0024B63D33|nr:hypothetical protein [Rhodococcus sp. IEGM 1379]MDI9914431.1 hypothetical protein [Rhodococcus sp. IEGM 1379]